MLGKLYDSGKAATGWWRGSLSGLS